VAADHDRRARGRRRAQYSVGVFAFQVLPDDQSFSSRRCVAALYYFGVMQLVVRVFACHAPLHAASGAESLNVAASIFMGQTEAPLTIRPSCRG
jgi:CNT family concentrative nucleoside transporter